MVRREDARTQHQQQKNKNVSSHSSNPSYSSAVIVDDQLCWALVVSRKYFHFTLTPFSFSLQYETPTTSRISSLKWSPIVPLLPPFQTVCSHNARILKSKLMAEQSRICFSGPVEHGGGRVDSWSLPFFYSQSFPGGSCPKKFRAGTYCPKKFQRWYVQTLYQSNTSDIRHNFCSAQELTSSEDFQDFLTTNFLNRLPSFTLFVWAGRRRRRNQKACNIHVHHHDDGI